VREPQLTSGTWQFKPSNPHAVGSIGSADGHVGGGGLQDVDSNETLQALPTQVAMVFSTPQAPSPAGGPYVHT
jgi:hypothetical protein